MKPKQLFQAVLSAITLTVLLVLVEIAQGGARNFSTFSLNLLANFLIAGILGYYITHSRYNSYKLWLSTFIIFYVIGFFNVIIEAYIFNIMDRGLVIKPMLFGIPYTLTGSFLMVLIHGRMKKEFEPSPSFVPRKALTWIGKILLANFLYIFFYLIAGISVETLTPGFSEFYEDKLPSMETFFMTNMLFRGFIFVGIAILIDRSIQGSRWAKALAVGLVFSIVGGIAPVIPPSEHMPDFIRFAHGFEVGISNLLYGMCVFLIVRSREGTSNS